MEAVSELWRGFLETYQGLAVQNRIFAIASAAVIILVVITILFAAYTLWLRVRNAVRARVWAEREARWTNITLDALTGERTVEEVVLQVAPDEDLPFLDFLLRYARRVRGEEQDRVRELAGPFLGALRPQLHDSDPYVRARAVQTLGTLGLAQGADELVRAVGDESSFVSMLAARSLALYGGIRYIDPVLENLGRFEKWGSEYVTSLLVSLGPDAAPRLREVLEDAELTPRIRGLVAAALTRLHDLGAVPHAVRTLRRNPPADLATELLRLLQVLGSPHELDTVRMLVSHPHFAVRAEAYSALGVLAGAEDEELLETGLEDVSPWVVLHAARALKDRGANLELHRLSESDHPAARAAGQVLAEE